jgi:hypothetical protein
MAGQLLLINPSRRRGGHKAKRRRHHHAKRRHNPMPAALARYWAHKGGAHHKRRRRHHARRHNPLRAPRTMKGFLGQVVPMTAEAAMGAAGSLAIDWVWGQVNPRLPAAMQSAPGKVGVGDAVKVIGTVALGTLTNRATRGFGMKAARGALTVQLERILRAALPDSVRMQLAYASPAAVTSGTWWSGPNRIYRGSPLALPNTMGALQRPGGRTPLLNALQRPGGRSPLMSGANLAPQAVTAGLRF